jgi:hypothetical protein
MFEKRGARGGIDSSSESFRIARADGLVSQRLLLQHDATFLINQANAAGVSPARRCAYRHRWSKL